jgi:hypothetical protein
MSAGGESMDAIRTELADRACSKQASAAQAVVAGEMGVLRKCVCVNGDRWPGCLFSYSG